MKVIPLILFHTLFIVFAHFCSSAQKYTPPISAELDSLGVMKNTEGIVFAVISTDSIIKDVKGEKIASIDRNGKLISKDGTILGGTSQKGDFYNTKNEIEFIVLPYNNGIIYNVYDNTGYHVFTVPSNYKIYAGSLAYILKNILSCK